MILCSRGKFFFGVVLFPLKLPPPGHPETTWILWFCWVLNSQVFCIQVVQNWVFIGRPTIEPMEQLGIPITWGERLWEWTWAVWQNVWSRLIPVIFPFILTIGCFLTWNAWYGHYISRLQAFQLTGDAMLDLLTDSPEAARLAEHPIGVIAEGLLLSCFLTVGRIYGKIYWDWDVTQPKPPWSTAICWIFEEFEQQVEHLQMNLSSKKWETNNEGILSWCIYVLLWIIWIFMFYSSVHQSCSFYDHFRSSWSMWKVLKGVVTLRIASKAVHSMSLKWHRPVVRSSAVEELWEFDFSDCFSRIIFQLVSGRLLRGLGPAWPLHSGGICSDGLFVRRQRPSGRSWGLWPLPRRFSIAIVRKDMWKVLKPEFRRWYPCISQVYHLRSLAKSWKNPPDSEVAVNGSSLTWLLREIFTGLDLDVIFFLNKNWETFGLAIHKCHFLRETRDGGGSVEAHILFCLGQGKPAVSDLTDLTPWHPSLRSVGVRVISLRYCFDGVDGGFCKSPDESSSCLTVVNFIGIVKVPDWGDFCFFFIPR